ncbi:hypothetical protein [Faecalicatena faecalis]
MFGFNGKVQILAPESVKEQYRQMIEKANEEKMHIRRSIQLLFSEIGYLVIELLVKNCIARTEQSTELRV